ncbi:MAG: flavodoxin family protein [Clostridia bacterium]|nr:flavodoxin family protein [Clostridia bacterium]
MKTLIFNGSPHANGDTAAMIRTLSAGLPGVVETVDAYRTDIRPCIDCRHCWKTPGCIFDDGMHDLLHRIADADCIIIASPVYYSMLTGPLLSLLSRLQVLYTAGRFHGVRLITRPKVGAVLLSAGGNGSPAPAEEIAVGLLRCMHATHVGTVCAAATDTTPAADDTTAMAALHALCRDLIAAHEEFQQNPQ